MPKSPEEALDWLVKNLWEQVIGDKVEAVTRFLPDTLSSVFFAIFLVGFLFLILAFLLGEVFDGFGDFFHGALDFLHIDVDHPDIDHGDGGSPSVFSPRVLAVFVTIFGGTGFITSINNHGPFVSSGAGLMGGIVGGALFYAFFSWIYRQESTSTLSNSSLVGRVGTVRTAIPKGELGEVVVDYVGSRVVRPARSLTGKEIPENRTVRVTQVLGRTLVVSQETDR